MRFVHFADTHLGFSDLARIDAASGVNRRELDFYETWWRVIDDILKLRPDFVLHAGDLFQSPRPNNRAIAVALEGLQRLNDAHIPFVVIAGNHSMPRIRATGSIFEALAVLPNVYAAHRGAYEKFLLRAQGTLCAIHCIPHCSLSEELERAYAAVQRDATADWNLLMMHGSWRAAGKIDTRMGEFNEQFLEDPEARLNLNFDYIALGHYHRFLALNDHTFYSGSTERTSFNEAGYTSGYILGDLHTKSWQYQKIAARAMIRLRPIDCRGKSVDEIIAEAQARSSDDLTGAMVTLEFRNLAREAYLQLDMAAIDAVFAQAFHVDKQFTFAAAVSALHASGETLGVGSLREEFSKFLAARAPEDATRADLERRGWHYLAAAETLEQAA